MFAAGLFLASTCYGPPNVLLTAPSVIAQSVGLLTLTSLAALTVFGTEAALRDSEHRVAALVYATPVTMGRLLFARFGRALLVSSVAFACRAPLHVRSLGVGRRRGRRGHGVRHALDRAPAAERTRRGGPASSLARRGRLFVL